MRLELSAAPNSQRLLDKSSGSEAENRQKNQHKQNKRKTRVAFDAVMVVADACFCSCVFLVVILRVFCGVRLLENRVWTLEVGVNLFSCGDFEMAGPATDAQFLKLRLNHTPCGHLPPFRSVLPRYVVLAATLAVYPQARLLLNAHGPLCGSRPRPAPPPPRSHPQAQVHRRSEGGVPRRRSVPRGRVGEGGRPRIPVSVWCSSPVSLLELFPPSPQFGGHSTRSFMDAL